MSDRTAQKTRRKLRHAEFISASNQLGNVGKLLKQVQDDVRRGNFFSFFSLTSSHRRAFTLSEVLITLGIIGVVAAMTIPTLMNDIQDTQYKTAYKKAYSTLSQALSQANTDNALLESSGAYDVNILTDFVTIMSYMKVQKTCYDYLTIGGAANNSQCWNRDGEGYNSSAYKNGSPMLYDLVAVDASGMSWATYARGYNYAILVDTNGMKPPNQMGKDRFIFALRDKAGNSGSVVSDVPIKVTPDSDNNSWTCNYNKCATENNYFPTTWLMK